MRNIAVSILALLLVILGWGILSLGEQLPQQQQRELQMVDTTLVPGAGERREMMRSEKRDVAPFTAIEVRGFSEVRITCQEPRGLELRTDHGTLPGVSTEVHGSTLIIDRRRHDAPRQLVQVIITVPDIESVVLSGSGDVRLYKVKNDSLELVLSGSGEIRAAGETGVLTARLSGSGSMDLSGLHAGKTDITLSGSGDAQVYAVEELNASLSGSGDVIYHGGPKVVNKRVSGSGSINASYLTQ
jgi:hypothetical protein